MIIIGDFNVDILTKTCQSTTLHSFMNTKKFKLLFFNTQPLVKQKKPHMNKCTNTTMSFRIYSSLLVGP
jgi:hypothetical protein